MNEMLEKNPKKIKSLFYSTQKPRDNIEVDLNLDQFDVTSVYIKISYAQIKDYVLKEYYLKVSNLYISQVKMKCVIKVGNNYNLMKSENAKQLN